MYTNDNRNVTNIYTLVNLSDSSGITQKIEHTNNI